MKKRWLSTFIPNNYSGTLNGKKNVSSIIIGDWSACELFISDKRVLAFAEATGDFNPIHLDEETGKQSRFGRRIAHGFLSASLFPTLFAFCFPGSVYLSQDLKFKSPVYLGDTVKANIKIEKIDKKPRNFGTVVTCTTQCTVDSRSTVVVDGVAKVLIPT